MALRGMTRLGADAIGWFANSVGSVPVKYLRTISSVSFGGINTDLPPEFANLPLPLPVPVEATPDDSNLHLYLFGFAAIALAGGAYWAYNRWAQNAQEPTDPEPSHEQVYQPIAPVTFDIPDLDIDWDERPAITVKNERPKPRDTSRREQLLVHARELALGIQDIVELDGNAAATEQQKVAKAYPEPAEDFPEMDMDKVNQMTALSINLLANMMTLHKDPDPALNQQMIQAGTDVAKNIKNTMEMIGPSVELNKAVKALEQSLQRLTDKAKALSQDSVKPLNVSQAEKSLAKAEKKTKFSPMFEHERQEVTPKGPESTRAEGSPPRKSKSNPKKT